MVSALTLCLRDPGSNLSASLFQLSSGKFGLIGDGKISFLNCKKVQTYLDMFILLIMAWFSATGIFWLTRANFTLLTLHNALWLNLIILYLLPCTTYSYCHPSAYGLGLASENRSAWQEINKPNLTIKGKNFKTRNSLSNL